MRTFLWPVATRPLATETTTGEWTHLEILEPMYIIVITEVVAMGTSASCCT